MKDTGALPHQVLAHWKAEDWDDDTMTASRYTYEALDNDGLGDGPIALTEKQASLYTWGQIDDNLDGGSQLGCLQETH